MLSHSLEHPIIFLQLNNSPEIISERILQKHDDDTVSQRDTKISTNTEGVLDRNKISEMRKLVHELDNNLSISSQHSSSESSKDEKCDACIHTQPISTADG